MEISKFLPDVEADTESLKQSILNEPHIQELIETLDLSDADIDLNLNTLVQYHRLKTDDPTLPKGLRLSDYDVVCVRNGDYLAIEHVLKQEVYEKQQALAFTKNYWLNHLPERLLTITPDEVIFKDYLDLAGIITLYDSTPDSFEKGLFLYGDTGVGKTYLMALYANQQAKRGYSVCFVTMSRLLNEIKQTFNYKSDTEVETIMSQLSTCDLLVLDDIGSEAVTQWSRDEILFTILNNRMEANRMTCFTSNLDEASLRQFYLEAGKVEDEIKSERLMERFLVLAEFFELESKKGSFRRTI